MRGLRSTILFVVVAAALAAYIFGYLNKKPADEGASKKEKVFAGLAADKIDELQVKANGDTTSLKKADNAWRVTTPVDSKADEAEVSGITTNLATIEMNRVVDENAKDLKDYGLAEPAVDIAFKAAGEKEFRHLLLGDKTPTGADLFARRGGDNKVFVVSQFLETTFRHGTFDLRDKAVMTFDRDKIDAIDVVADGKPLGFAKSGGDWKLARPVQTPADFATVEGLVGKLQTLQMKSLETENATPADLKKFGLDKPTVTVTLNMGSAQATLAVGGKAGDTALYARDLSKTSVVTIETSAIDDLKKGPDEYRKKDVFDFRAYNASRLEIFRDGKTWVFEKVKGDGKDVEDKWKRVSPTAAEPTKDNMDSLLTRLANLRASGFAEPNAKTGLNTPVATVTVKFGDPTKEEKVTFGQVGDDVFAARSGEPGAAKVDKTDFEQAMKALDELAK